MVPAGNSPHLGEKPRVTSVINRRRGLPPSCGLNLTGPTNKNKPRMDINIGEPSGSTDPVSHLQQSGETSSSEARIFHCEFPDCGRVFKTKTGRGVHHQKVHKDWYDAKQPREQLKAGIQRKLLC